MAEHVPENWAGTDDGKMNSHYQKLLNDYKKSMDSAGHDVIDIPHMSPPKGDGDSGVMHTGLMSFTQMLESITMIAENCDNPPCPESGDDLENVPVTEPTAPVSSDNTDLLDELNQIFTPILVMQNFEGDMPGKIQEALSEASVLMERNIIQFDDATRMAQLIAVCSLLIAKKKNTPEYQMYQKAAVIRNKMKLDIQRKEYDEAKALAQQFLVKVSTTNNSSIARDAATSLLPETQH